MAYLRNNRPTKNKYEVVFKDGVSIIQYAIDEIEAEHLAALSRKANNESTKVDKVVKM